MQNTTISKKHAIWLLAPMVISLALAMDVYVPAVPRIATLFHTSAGKMQLTLTLFMFAAGALQLFVGPVSDQVGRKKSALIVITLYALGTALCAMAQSLHQLIAFRILQALGSCGMLVVGFAVVRDTFHGDDSGQVYSYLNSLIAFSPMFAPFVGSYLDIHFGWPSTFLSLLVIAALATFSMTYGLPETLPPARRKKFDVGIFKEYYSIFTNRLFFVYTLSTAIGLTYLYLFCSISPYIIIRQLHIPEAYYGFYFCFMGISFFIGGVLSARIIKKIGIYRTSLLGFVITLIGGVIMAGWYFIAGLSINNFVWPMLLIGMGGTFCMGAGTSGSMEPFANMAGAAAALGGAFRFLFASAVGAIVIGQNVTSTLPLALPAVIFSIVGIILFKLFLTADH